MRQFLISTEWPMQWSVAMLEADVAADLHLAPDDVALQKTAGRTRSQCGRCLDDGEFC
jgi:hypothetical protein